MGSQFVHGTYWAPKHSKLGDHIVETSDLDSAEMDMRLVVV